MQERKPRISRYIFAFSSVSADANRRTRPSMQLAKPVDVEILEHHAAGFADRR